MIIVANKRYCVDGEYVGRPSVLGNPFVMKSESDRLSVIEQYEKWITEKLENDEKTIKEFNRLLEKYKSDGKLTLLCWCSPKKCHADVIKKILMEKISEQKIFE